MGKIGNIFFFDKTRITIWFIFHTHTHTALWSSFLRFGCLLDFVQFKRLERFAKVFVLPLGARFAFDRTTPPEGAIAGRRDQHPPRVVTASAAQQIASVNTFRCFITRPACCTDRTWKFRSNEIFNTNFSSKIYNFEKNEIIKYQSLDQRSNNRMSVPDRRVRGLEAVWSLNFYGSRWDGRLWWVKCRKDRNWLLKRRRICVSSRSRLRGTRAKWSNTSGCCKHPILRDIYTDASSICEQPKNSIINS